MRHGIGMALGVGVVALATAVARAPLRPAFPAVSGASPAASGPPAVDTGAPGIAPPPGDSFVLEDPSPPLDDTGDAPVPLIPWAALSEVLAWPGGCGTPEDGAFVEVYNASVGTPLDLHRAHLRVDGVDVPLRARQTVLPGHFGVIASTAALGSSCATLSPAATWRAGAGLPFGRGAHRVELVDGFGRVVTAATLPPAERARSWEWEVPMAFREPSWWMWCASYGTDLSIGWNHGTPGRAAACGYTAYDSADGVDDFRLEVRTGGAGGLLTLVAHDAPPQSEVVFYASRTGPGVGTCAPSGSPCTGLADDVRIGRAHASGDGVAVLEHVVPGTLASGTTVWLQAVSGHGAGTQFTVVTEVTVTP